MKRTLTLAIFLTFVIGHSSFVLAQGPLTPPGAPAPTMKTLDQVEARIIVNAANTPGDGTNTFIITQRGSYYLTGNITGAFNKHGISIRANDVTLDLNGFALVSGGLGTVRGIDVPVAQTGLCIRNGNISNWTSDGVHGQLATMRAEKLNLSNNTGIGLAVSNGSLVQDCVASGNGIGFRSDDRVQIINCISTVNGEGFICTSFVNVMDCTSSRNGNNGILVGSSCSVMRCNVTRNGGTGIYFDSSCHLAGNTCDSNYDGITLSGSGSRIDGNSCNSNTRYGYHIATGSNNLVIRNSAHANSENYYLGNQNPAGPIVDMTAGGTITSTSPWANFTF